MNKTTIYLAVPRGLRAFAYSYNSPEMYLFQAVKSHKLTKSFLKRLLQSRELRLLKSFCVTTEDLLKYSEDSVSCVYYLALEGCGVKNVHADHAASHLGKAQGIANMLRLMENELFFYMK